MIAPTAVDLDALGVHPLPERGAARFALLQTARQLWQGGCRVIGLQPATERVATTGLGLQLARALCDLNLGPVAVLDANPSRPALSHLVPESARQQLGFVELSFERGPIVLTTRACAATGQAASATELALVVRDYRQRFKITLLDLAGFRELGQHFDAYDCVDGVLLVAHAGKTGERDVLRASREIPERVNLGVLLIDP